MFLLNSRLGLFSATISLWFPFSRSYGVILPSSLTTVLSPTLGFSPHLPVSVYGTGTFVSLAAFPGSLIFGASLLLFHSPSRLTIAYVFYPICSLAAWTRSTNGVLPASSCVPASVMQLRWYGIYYPLSINYAFQPCLRSRLTLSGQTFLRKPWVFGRRGSHPPLVTHANILSCMLSTFSFNQASSYIHCSPTIL